MKEFKEMDYISFATNLFEITSTTILYRVALYLTQLFNL
jgi:hypothetical protein